MTPSPLWTNTAYMVIQRRRNGEPGDVWKAAGDSRLFYTPEDAHAYLDTLGQSRPAFGVFEVQVQVYHKETQDGKP